MMDIIILAIIVILFIGFLGCAWEEPAGGIIAVVVGIIAYWSGSHTAGIIIGIIGVACYIHVKSENSPKSENRPEKIKERRFPPVHFTLRSTGPYYSILNECEQIVWSIAKRCSGMEFHVYVMVEKLNSTNCSVDFWIADVPFKYFNISFGNEFEISDSLTANFKTEQATGFTTAQYIMGELNRQFHWHDVSTHITESKINDFGYFKNHPMIILKFDVKDKE